MAERQRRLPGLRQKMIALHAGGMMTHEIQRHLKELCTIEVSPSLISTVTGAALDDVKASERWTRPVQISTAAPTRFALVFPHRPPARTSSASIRRRVH